MPKLKTLICKRPSSVLNYNYRREVNCIKKLWMMVFHAGYFRLVFNCIFTYPIFNVSFSRLALSSRNRRRLKPKKHPKDKTLLAANFRLWFWRLWRYYYGLPRILLSYSNLGLAITPITHFKGRFSSLSKSLAIIYCVFRSATTWFPRSKKKGYVTLRKNGDDERMKNGL